MFIKLTDYENHSSFYNVGCIEKVMANGQWSVLGMVSGAVHEVRHSLDEIDQKIRDLTRPQHINSPSLEPLAVGLR